MPKRMFQLVKLINTTKPKFAENQLVPVQCLPVFTLPQLCLAARAEREVVATAYQQEYKFRVQHPWGQFRGSKMGSFRVRDK